MPSPTFSAFGASSVSCPCPSRQVAVWGLAALILPVIGAGLSGCEGVAEPAEQTPLARGLAPLPPVPAPSPPEGLAQAGGVTERAPPAGLTRGETGAFAPAGGPCSRGPTHGGSLVSGATLPDVGEGFVLLPQTIRRDARHGHPTLVEALRRAARRVATLYPGSTLHVGDLSIPDGGNFGPHRSHTNGRDVDLAFYLADADGAPADVGRMQTVGRDGALAGGGRFDARRNWALVALLLRDPAIQVQWVFVADHLRALLLSEAGRDDPALAERAARVLLQPRDSSPHADHFHVRIYCDQADRLAGCVDAPPFHAWVDDHRDALELWLTSLAPFLAMPGTEEFRYAVTRIAEGGVSAALPQLEALQTPPRASDAWLLADAIAHLRGDDTRPEWSRLRPLDAPP